MINLLFLLAFTFLTISPASPSLAMEPEVKGSGFDVGYASEIIGLCRIELMSMQEKLSLSDKNSLALFLQQLLQLKKVEEPGHMQVGIRKIAEQAAEFKFSKYAKIDPDFFLILVRIQNSMQYCLDGRPIQVITTPEENDIKIDNSKISDKLSEDDLCDMMHVLQRKRRATVFSKADFMKSCRSGSLSWYLKQIDVDSLIQELEAFSPEESVKLDHGTEKQETGNNQKSQ